MRRVRGNKAVSAVGLKVRDIIDERVAYLPGGVEAGVEIGRDLIRLGGGGGSRSK